MGGNVSVMNKSGVEVRAEKLDFKAIERYGFVREFKHALENLSVILKHNKDVYMWDDLNAGIFSGSGSHLFNSRIPTNEFLQYKPVMGDIDVMVDETIKESVWEMLNEIIGKPVTDNITYIGNNRPNYSDKNKQINCVFQYHDTMFQVDFEFLPFEGGAPSEWSTFSHSSSWEDIKMGIKGVHHKFLLRSIAGAISKRDDIVIMTPKATPENPRVKKLHKVPSSLKFSVDHGLREAYEEQKIETGPTGNDWEYWTHEGKIAAKEIPVSDSYYETNLIDIFSTMFHSHQEYGNAQADRMRSFKGLIDLLDVYQDEEAVAATFENYVKLLWGKYAQAMERNDPDADFTAKYPAYMYFFTRFKHVLKNDFLWQVEKLRDDYYENYRMDAE